MGRRDPRVDAYIAKSPDFAKPVLIHLRTKIHEAVPDVEETIKWGVPHFDYHGPMCMMASFRAHCRFGFWVGNEVDGAKAVAERIESVRDLPPDRKLVRLIKQAAALRKGGVKMARTQRAKPPLRVPSYFAAALAKNKKAAAAFQAFPPSHKREYVEWITGAKTDETRQRRLATAVQWITEGKSRNWKYQRPRA
jgi:hypothetical protein